MMDLHIHRLENRYRLPPDVAEARGTARRLEDVAASGLPPALEAVLPGVAARVGLAPESEIAVRRIGIRVHVADPSLPPEQVVASWAKAFAAALERALGKTPGFGIGPEIAIFRDRFAAEVCYLVALARASDAEWWWRPLLAERDRLPTPTQTVARWIDEAPERMPAELARLAREVSDGVGALFSDSDGESLAKRLIDRRAKRSRELVGRVSGPNPVAPHDHRLVEALASDLRQLSLHTRGARRLLALAFLLERSPASRVDTVAELDRLVRRARSTLVRPTRSTLVRPTPSMHDDGAERDDVTSRSDAAPETGTVSPDTDQLPAKMSGREPPFVATADEARPEQTTVVHHEPSVADGGKPANADSTRRAWRRVEDDKQNAEEDEAPESSEDRFHEVGCAGLLFLVRPLARHALVQTHGGESLETRLLAFGRLVLGRVLDPLPRAIRHAAFERERPLLEVFTGAEVRSDTFDDGLESGEVIDDAATALAEIAAAIPREIVACSNALHFTYGAMPDPFPDDGPARALAHLVLRHGRLRVTGTHADLYLPLRSVDVEVRRAGWDIDPGWVPYLGRVIRFHYGES